MRAMSARAPKNTGKSVCFSSMFIGSAERRLTKPPCTSALIERQCARATGSAGRTAGCREAGRQAGVREAVLQVLADGKGVPHRDTLVLEPRDQERRGEQQQLRAGARVAR